MSLLWVRPPLTEASFLPEERRVRDFLDSGQGISESVVSLASKLGIHPRRCRRVLDRLVEEGLLRRHDYDDIAPLYCRFPGR